MTARTDSSDPQSLFPCIRDGREAYLDAEHGVPMVEISKELSNKIANMGFVCALLVVSIHLGFGSYPRESLAWHLAHGVRTILSPVAVPYFFLMAGFLLGRHCEEAGWWQRAVKTRVRTLLVPFVFWGCAMFAVSNLLLPLIGGGTWKALTLKVALAQLGWVPWEMPNPIVLWFLRSLFLFVILSGLIVAFIRKTEWVALLVLAVLYFYGPMLGLYVLEKMAVPTTSLCYFSFGLFLCQHPVGVKRPFATGAGCLGLMLGVLQIVLGVRGVSGFDWLPLFVTPLMMLGLWSVIPTSSWPKWMVGNSFAIYICHMFVLCLLFRSPTLHAMRSVPVTVVNWLLVVGGTIVFASLVRAVFPKFAQMIFGGR